MNLTDRAKAALVAFVDAIVGPYDYAAAASCTVVAQNGDGTLELEPESARLPRLSGVPIRWPGPGIASVDVRPGARVLLEFEGADPSRPVVTAWDSSASRDVVRFDTDGAPGVAPVARKGDLVSVAFPLGMTITGAVSIPPATPPQVITVCSVVSPVPPVSGGVIVDGNPRVLA